jgi:hypothetical protein
MIALSPNVFGMPCPWIAYSEELLFERVIKVTRTIANQSAWYFSSNIFSFLEERINVTQKDVRKT